MKLYRSKSNLEIVWRNDADPSPEFYQYAEPGRVLIRKRKNFASAAELKAVDHVAGRGDRTPPFPNRRSPQIFLTSVIFACAVILIAWVCERC